MKSVLKFGGTCLCDCKTIKMARDVVLANPNCKVVIASAAGKRFNGDKKITDILIEFCKNRKHRQPFDLFCKRTMVAANFFGVGHEILLELENLNKNLFKLDDDFIISRGEYFSAKILAKACNMKFVDASKVFVCTQGKIDIEKSKKNAHLLTASACVVPGFYGVNEFGETKILQRGGSDETAAVAALILGAKIFEKWTDVDGIFSCPKNLSGNVLHSIDYETAKKVCCGEHAILSARSLEILQSANVCTKIKNINHPCEEGSVIL